MSCEIFPIPPEYRFRPTKKELLCDHLEKKNQCKDSQSMSIIPVIDLCKHEPHELPGLAFTGLENLGRKLFFFFFFWFTRAESWDSQGKWYFFAPRDYKYPNSSTRSNRTTGEGSWKVTGKDKDIKAPGSEAVIGRKRILTFQKRGVPKSHKSGWVIHEYYHIQPHSDPPKQIGDFVVCCLKYKSDNFVVGSGSCSMVSDVANQLVEENLASNEQFNGTDDEAETGGGRITEAEEYLAYKTLRDELRIPIGNQNEFQGSQTDPCNLWTSVEGQADRSNSSHMIEERLDDPENMDSFFHTPAPPQLHQLHQSPMNTTNVHNDECRKRKYPFEDNDSSLTKKNNISTNDGDELVSNTTSNSENQAADVILEGDSVICRLKNKSDKKDSLVSDEGEPDSTGVSNWKIQAAHKNDEPLFHLPQPLDDCCSSAVWASLELEAVLQAIGTNDDCNKLQSPCGDITSCLEDKNEVSTCDEDENMDGVFPQLCDPPDVNQDSLLRPLQPQDYCPSILQSPIYPKLGNVPDANLCFSECNDWQSAFKKKNSTNEVDIPIRHIMSNFEHQATDSRILEVHRQSKENMESAFYPFQPQDPTLHSMIYTIPGDDLHNIECNELQFYSSDQTAQTPSINSNLPKSLGRVYPRDSGVSSYDTNIEVAHGWEQHTSTLAIGNPPIM
ncbi:NAC domain containing protein 50-like isoform X2 [Rosa rugosa]|uniref:NAC domain containing protein 50-like isoform X2 n=1 Tax=Rosa rugosa TaxID=74645 RepID=UPI002B415764|nr:NAC domain containing protein 50-like isoform X2 [Rosa rugosa]